MTLSLNLAYEGDRYRNFSGRNVDQILLLLASGRVPLSAKDLMERRLEVRKPDFGTQYKDTEDKASVQAVRDGIWKQYVDTGDGVLYSPDGKIKVVTDAAFLRALTPQSLLQNGAVVLTDDLYRKTDAPEFTREQVENDRFGTVWLALARGDNTILTEYRKAVAAELKARLNIEGENMKLFLAHAQKITTGRLWCVSRGLDSVAYGVDPDYDYGCLIGVAPEAQGVNLERRV